MERGKRGHSWRKAWPPIDGESVASHHFGEEEKEGEHASFLIPIQVGVKCGKAYQGWEKSWTPTFLPIFLISNHRVRAVEEDKSVDTYRF